MSDTSRFQDGGIYLEQVGALPATGTEGALVTKDNVLYQWRTSAWVAMTGAGVGAAGTVYAQAANSTPVVSSPAVIEFDTSYTVPIGSFPVGSTYQATFGGSYGTTTTDDLTLAIFFAGVGASEVTTGPTASGGWSIVVEVTRVSTAQVRYHTVIKTQIPAQVPAVAAFVTDDVNIVAFDPAATFRIAAGAGYEAANAANTATQIYGDVIFTPASL